ncbi:MAG: DUF885 domain-containing protein [Pseudomonadota bacterium]
MKRVAKWTSGLLFSLVLLASILLAHTWYFKPVTIDLFYTRVFAAYALKSPEMLSTLHILPGFLDFHSDKFDDVSPAAQQTLMDGVKQDLATLRRYDRAGMNREGQLSFDTLVHFLQSRVDGERFRDHDFPVNQNDGVQSTLPDFMVNVHEVESRADADNYIARLMKFPQKFEQTRQQMALSEAKGILPPRFTIDKVLAQMKGFIAPAPRENILFVTFAEKLKKIPAAELDQDARASLLTAAAKAIDSGVYPAYRSLISHFTSLQQKTQANDGAWSMAQGDAYYAYKVRYHTTTAMTPEQVHDIGLAEVARVAAEMDVILKAQGLNGGSTGARVQRLSSRAEQQFSNTPDGRKAMLARYQDILSDIDKGMNAAFDMRPKLGVLVKAVPEYAQATAPLAYYSPGAMDGSRPGYFNANMRNPGETPKFAMKSLAYHEGIPGHHFQAALAQDMQDVPFFRTVISFTAYTEGWALYAEKLAGELGHGNEGLDALGRLSYEMLRASRLVVDTGVHSKRWTREQAIAYMVENTGMDQEKVVSEVERYFVDPGQALGYEVGMLKILALRERARKALGPRFDLKQFHNEVLGHGELPLTVLEGVVDDWIARKKG